jgi:hypothetical protein
MVVDGKDFRAQPLIVTRICLFFVLLCSCGALAENTTPLRSLDLRPVLCDSSQVQINTPKVGVEFLSENQILAYAVCRSTGEPMLARRGRFLESDSKQLKAAIIDVATGQVERTFDWPTHGDQSSISVTAKGNLLVVRDNILDTYDVYGKQVAHLELQRANFHDPLLMAPSYAVSTLSVTEIALTAKGALLTATLVLDADTLRPLFHWAAQNEPENRVIAASPALAAGWQEFGDQKHVVIRTPQDKDWQMIWTGKTASMFGPIFLTPESFVMATDHAVLIFNGSGRIESQTNVNAPSQITVARDGKRLAMAVADDSASPAFLPPTRIDVFSTSFQRLATLTNFTTLDSDFTLCLSPSGDELAILGDLRVKLLRITH